MTALSLSLVSASSAYAASMTEGARETVRGCYQVISYHQIEDYRDDPTNHSPLPASQSGVVICINIPQRGTYRTAPQPYLAFAVRASRKKPSVCHQFPLQKFYPTHWKVGFSFEVLQGTARKPVTVRFLDTGSFSWTRSSYVGPKHQVFVLSLPPELIRTMDFGAVLPSIDSDRELASVGLARIPETDNEALMGEMFRDCE